MRTLNTGLDCLESRRLLLAAPREQAPHAQTCESCTAFARELAETDDYIADALLVSVPDGLEHRVMLTRYRLPKGTGMVSHKQG
jgi:hypothetical protein